MMFRVAFPTLPCTGQGRPVFSGCNLGLQEGLNRDSSGVGRIAWRRRHAAHFRARERERRSRKGARGGLFHPDVGEKRDGQQVALLTGRRKVPLENFMRSGSNNRFRRGIGFGVLMDTCRWLLNTPCTGREYRCEAEGQKKPYSQYASRDSHDS